MGRAAPIRLGHLTPPIPPQNNSSIPQPSQSTKQGRRGWIRCRKAPYLLMRFFPFPKPAGRKSPPPLPGAIPTPQRRWRALCMARIPMNLAQEQAAPVGAATHLPPHPHGYLWEGLLCALRGWGFLFTGADVPAVDAVTSPLPTRVEFDAFMSLAKKPS